MNWLAKLFIKNHEDTGDAKVRTAYGKLSGWVGIVCNALLFAVKIIAGTVSGSVSITADAVNNLSDASSSVISLLGFKMAEKPADAEHPYGHARYEYLSGFMVAILILVIGIELLKGSIEKILAPTDTNFNIAIPIVLLACVAVKLWLALYNRKIGKLIDSQALIASAADCRNDVISTLAVLAALVISHFTSINLDGFMGIAVALFILYSGFGIVKDTLDPLLGAAPDAQFVEAIHSKIMSYPNVLGTHDLMIHDYGPGRKFASVHVEMAAEADVLASHDVIDNIERDFLEQDGLHMIVHFDPIVTNDASVSNLRVWLSGLVTEIHPDLSIHDLRIVPGPTHTNLIFDCVMPHNLKMTESALKSTISQAVSDKYPSYYCVITIDNSYAPVIKNK